MRKRPTDFLGQWNEHRWLIGLIFLLLLIGCFAWLIWVTDSQPAPVSTGPAVPARPVEAGEVGSAVLLGLWVVALLAMVFGRRNFPFAGVAEFWFLAMLCLAVMTAASRQGRGSSTPGVSLVVTLGPFKIDPLMLVFVLVPMVLFVDFCCVSLIPWIRSHSEGPRR